MANANRKAVIVDFDGTCTKAKRGADNAFIAAHGVGLADMLGRTHKWVAERYAEAIQIIVDKPAEYGWDIDGRIVAPALVDAFVAAHVCAQIILKDLNEDVAAWKQRLDMLYADHYLKLETEFRPELLETFKALREREIPFYIVTNSDPKKVRVRLAALGADAEWINPLVHGFAKKYEITEGPTDVDEYMSFPGLTRPIYLRKAHYYKVLEEIRLEHDARWEDMLVVGDIAELDLAMPVTLGAHGCLMLGPNTPLSERLWAGGHARVRIIEDLREVI